MIGKNTNPKIILDDEEWIVEGFSTTELNHLYIRLYNPGQKKWSNYHIQKNYNEKDNPFTRLLKNKE